MFSGINVLNERSKMSRNPPKNRLYNPDDILEFIKQFKIESGGDSPSVRAIADKFGIKSTNTVQEILKRLEKKGKLFRVGGHRNGIKLPNYKFVSEEKAPYEA